MGQEVFSCNGYYIVQDSINGVIANCDDKLTVCLGTLIPPRHQNSPVESPIRVLAGFYDDNGNYKLTDVNGTISIDPSRGFVTFVPDSFPVSVIGDLNPIQYQVVMDCRYFYGPDNVDEYVRYLSKQNVIRACAQARSMTDSSDLSSNILLQPKMESCVHYLSNGLKIAAERNVGRWNFDHWESSISLAGLKQYELTQLLDNECWPLTDTVILTAWYRDVTLAVREDPAAENQITFAYKNGDIIVHDPATTIYKWILSDLQGRIISQTDSCLLEPCIISTNGNSGMAILIGVGLSHSYSTSLFLH
ncbi:MAG: hypothetical protein HYX66_09990 [Ignavibacteria bacterium]|nr:hypothetical protein [Ignavibacteria bacterium]